MRGWYSLGVVGRFEVVVVVLGGGVVLGEGVEKELGFEVIVLKVWV